MGLRQKKEYLANMCKVYVSGQKEPSASTTQFKNICITFEFSFVLFFWFKNVFLFLFFLTVLSMDLVFFINPCHLFISLLAFHSFSVYPRDCNMDGMNE